MISRTAIIASNPSTVCQAHWAKPAGINALTIGILLLDLCSQALYPVQILSHQLGCQALPLMSSCKEIEFFRQNTAVKYITLSQESVPASCSRSASTCRFWYSVRRYWILSLFCCTRA